MVMNPLFAKTPKFQMVKSSFKVKPMIFYGQFAHLLMAKPCQTRIYPYFFIHVHHVPFILPSFSHHFLSIPHHFPINSPSFTHHFPIIYPSIPHHFPIIYPSFSHHFSWFTKVFPCFSRFLVLEFSRWPRLAPPRGGNLPWNPHGI